MKSVGVSLGRQGKYEQSEAIYKQTLDFRGKVLGRDHTITLESVRDLARVLRQQGRDEEAEKILQSYGVTER